MVGSNWLPRLRCCAVNLFCAPVVAMDNRLLSFGFLAIKLSMFVFEYWRYGDCTKCGLSLFNRTYNRVASVFASIDLWSRRNEYFFKVDWFNLRYARENCIHLCWKHIWSDVLVWIQEITWKVNDLSTSSRIPCYAQDYQTTITFFFLFFFSHEFCEATENYTTFSLSINVWNCNDEASSVFSRVNKMTIFSSCRRTIQLLDAISMFKTCFLG